MSALARLEARDAAALASTEDALREALRPITWQDVRLAVGEGGLDAADTLAGANAELRRRLALLPPSDSPQ